MEKGTEGAIPSTYTTATNTISVPIPTTTTTTTTTTTATATTKWRGAEMVLFPQFGVNYCYSISSTTIITRVSSAHPVTFHTKLPLKISLRKLLLL